MTGQLHGDGPSRSERPINVSIATQDVESRIANIVASKTMAPKLYIGALHNFARFFRCSAATAQFYGE